MVRHIGWTVMTLSAIGVAGYALAILFVADIRPAFVANLFSNLPTATYLHFLGGVR